jgi:hypothetical protein
LLVVAVVAHILQVVQQVLVPLVVMVVVAQAHKQIYMLLMVPFQLAAVVAVVVT